MEVVVVWVQLAFIHVNVPATFSLFDLSLFATQKMCNIYKTLYIVYDDTFLLCVGNLTDSFLST